MSTNANDGRLRIGVIGYGYWGVNIVRNFMNAPGATVAVVADHDAARLARARSAFPSVETTSDVDALLAGDRIDAVAIVTPVSTHFAIAAQALRSGKHVLVEKPMTATVEEAQQLVALAAQHKRTLMVDHTFLYNPAVRAIRQMIERGDLGEIFYYDSTRINLGLIQSDVSVIWDLAPHDFSMMDYLLGKQPRTIQAAGSAIQSDFASIAYVLAGFSDKTLAHFHLNWLSPTKVRRLIIGGSNKMVVFDMGNPEELVKVYDKGVDFVQREGVATTRIQYRIGDMHAPQIPATEPLTLMAREFVDSIREQRQPLTDGESGLRVVRLLTAAERSLNNGGASMLLM